MCRFLLGPTANYERFVVHQVGCGGFDTVIDISFRRCGYVHRAFSQRLITGQSTLLPTVHVRYGPACCDYQISRGQLSGLSVDIRCECGKQFAADSRLCTSETAIVQGNYLTTN